MERQVYAQGFQTDSLQTEVRLLYESRLPRYVTGSVSHISGDEVENIPGANRLNVLNGWLSGLMLHAIDGLPGWENSTLRIRGVHTFASNNRNPMVLIDGKVDDYAMLDPFDIESVTVLKDAAATAMYGLLGTNGILLIHTKKGKEGRIKVNFNTVTSLSQPTRMPEYLDAYNYALLYNEAQLNDDPNATVRYNNEALEGYRTGNNPYRYPNVDWTKEFLKDSYVVTRNNINVSGGGNTARYYVSANYLYNSGVFNVDEDLNTYNTNTTIKVMNAHGNVQVNVGKRLQVDADIRAKRDIRNAPGGYSTGYGETLINRMFATPFNAYPIKNADGSVAGTQDYRDNLYGLLNLRGYSIWERSSISSFTKLSYNLNDWIKGLRIEAYGGFNSYTDYHTNRTKNFAVYQLNADGETYTQIGLDSEIGQGGGYDNLYRNFDHGISLHYDRDYGLHHVGALLMYNRQQLMNGISATMATRNYQGPKGAFSYRYRNTYLLDLSFAYQGNEMFPPDNRYGFFPAAAAGWILTNESFMNNVKWLDFLKIRGSYGLTGNTIGSDVYFAWLSNYATTGSNYFFGNNASAKTGYYQSQVANPAVTWEKCLKTNIGIDMALFGNRLNASFDYFRENNRDILVSNSITAMYGATLYMPTGKFENKGYEVEASWNDRIGEFGYHLGLNLSKFSNRIVFQDEQYREYPWMYRTGKELGTRFGYTFERFFTENDDMSQLPDQSLLGSQRPGDLKYKDLNNDNVINDSDFGPIGKPKMPEINYGITTGFSYKGLSLSVMFHGTKNGTSYWSGPTYWEFYNKTGNVLKHHLDRWQPGSGQSAGYPRLTLSNTNNTQTSSYWVKDNSFLRLQFVELGYTLPQDISKKAGMSKTRIFVNANNLYCWDKMGIIDPEMIDGGLDYPIQRTISIGLNIGF
jgi:TonB-linked SusC/RagA family outer membrane protein